MEEAELKPIVSREELVKQGTSAIASLAGGVFLMLIAIGTRFPVLGLILSAAALVMGIIALMSRSREDKRPGLVLAAAGVLGLTSRFGIIRYFAGTFLVIGAIGLFAAGIIKGVKFLIGLKSRQ